MLAECRKCFYELGLFYSRLSFSHIDQRSNNNESNSQARADHRLKLQPDVSTHQCSRDSIWSFMSERKQNQINSSVCVCVCERERDGGVPSSPLVKTLSRSRGCQTPAQPFFCSSVIFVFNLISLGK